MERNKCYFCEHVDGLSWTPSPCFYCSNHNAFKLKTIMSKSMHSEWIGYCLSQGFKDGIEEEERKTEMDTNTVDKAVMVDRILKDFANHRSYHINGEYHLGAAKTAYEFTNGANKVTIEFNWNLTRDNIYELIGKTTKTVDEQIGNKSKEKEAKEMFKTACEKYENAMRKHILNSVYGVPRRSGKYPWGQNIPEIEKVIFNEPATIVIWGDGTKTVVKAQNGEPYDPEKGLAMAITKKALGNKREYYNTVKHWVKKYEKKDPEFDLSEVTNFKTLDEAKTVRNAMEDIIDNYGVVSVTDLYDLNAKEISYIGNMYGWNNIYVEDSPNIIKLADDHYRLVLPKYVRID